MNFLIRQDDLRGSEIAALLEAHLAHARAHSPPESIHALDLERLRAPEITFWSAWSDGELLGCGALKELARDHGEIKSMHTARAHRGKGVAAKLVAHILEVARARSYRRVSLETGTMKGSRPLAPCTKASGSRSVRPSPSIAKIPTACA